MARRSLQVSAGARVYHALHVFRGPARKLMTLPLRRMWHRWEVLDSLRSDGIEEFSAAIDAGFKAGVWSEAPSFEDLLGTARSREGWAYSAPLRAAVRVIRTRIKLARHRRYMRALKIVEAAGH